MTEVGVLSHTLTYVSGGVAGTGAGEGRHRQMPPLAAVYRYSLNAEQKDISDHEQLS